MLINQKQYFVQNNCNLICSIGGGVKNLVMRFDMRRPPDCSVSDQVRYQAALEMAVWAEGNGFDTIGLSEHHVTADGYLSSPLMLAMAIASRTERIAINVGALLLPLHEPLRIAEDIAVLDMIAKGRAAVTAGIGYRPEEYAALGRDWERRGELLDEGIEVLLKAWRGQPFEYRGRSAQVLPRPVSRVQQLLYVGGNSKAAARRAAHFGLVFLPAIDDPELVTAYQAECERLGGKRGFVVLPNAPATTFIAEDVEQGWRDYGPAMLFDAVAYGAWRHPNRRAYAESFASDMASLRAEGKYRILTPAQAVEVIRSTGSLHIAPLVGGADPALAWRSLQLFAEHVLPQL